PHLGAVGGAYRSLGLPLAVEVPGHLQPNGEHGHPPHEPRAQGVDEQRALLRGRLLRAEPLAAMPRAALTRRVTFSATHHYERPDWSEAQNREAFGASAAPHAHEYACEVTVRGDMDQHQGMVIDLAQFDRVLEAEVRARFDRRDINRDVAEFAPGALFPTCEN